MKALYLGFNRKYIHPQTDLIQRVFSSLTDLTFYGPGFSSEEEIHQGINQWCKSNEKFDIIILDGILVGYDKSESNYANSFKNSNEHIFFRPYEFAKYAEEYRTFFTQSKTIKFTFTTWDPYNIPYKDIVFLIQSNSYIIDVFGDRLSKHLNKLESKTRFKTFFTSNFNDNWIIFEKKYRHKIISFPHAIFASDFFYSPIEKRKKKFSIIGVLYLERKEVIKLLSSRARIELFFRRFTEFLIFKLKIKGSFKRIKRKIESYQSLIENSKFCYVSGSPLRYPVRKYFEVPSKGAVPIGWKCNGFENLGFKDGENFIVAENKETLSKYLSGLQDTKLSQIARNAQKLVFEKHSDYARISQLSESLKLIIDNSFNGSYWEDGSYKHY